ncbi:hypothetical protein MC7420_8010 [Coleofasciculus chthonoplastes PCC 7420]|uniref:Uncharacterized protein n=1 Tax=Coleofasciculus chthonoplastes PCC 7420 TaxID=118168 RepID=B4VJE7_9CYAN|nr:hypothetical protein MC7420_8010 [Coleofasciculus chthonoplastes PCC 7420]
MGTILEQLRRYDEAGGACRDVACYVWEAGGDISGSVIPAFLH